MENYDDFLNSQLQEMLAKMAARGVEVAELNRIKEAFAFAREAHSGQKRKSGEPYIIHPMAVARIVAE